VLDDPWEMPETIETVSAAQERGATVIVASEQPGSMSRLAGVTLTLSDGRPV
jgi:DNA-binding MurR/RpiR family transcriptional regulator